MFLKPRFLAVALLFCLATPAYALDVTLQWDANTESDLAGYNVYYRAGSSGGGILANYNGTGAYEGNSPIDMLLALDENPDPDIVEFTITDLPDGQTYYFVVTAYNDDVPPLESGPSNEENTTVPPSDTTPPYATNRSPAPGATGVAVNANVSLELRDAGAGVDQSAITMRVNGSPVTPSISGTPAAYTLFYNPTSDFPYDQAVLVELDASDLSGNEMATDAYSFTTGPAPDTTPPVISNVQASSITDTSAVITWTTDEASDSEIQYGTISGSYPSNRSSTNMVTSHTINLTGLSQDTSYYYRVSSKDAATNTRTSSEFTFTTDPPPDYAVQGLPLALQGSAAESNDVTLAFNNIPAGTTSIELVLTVFDADFSDEGRLFINGQGPIPLFGSQGVGANDGISVTLNPIATDADWYQLGQNTLTIWHDSTAGFTIENISVIFSTSPPPDTTPPVISNVLVTSITETTAIISWTTNEPSNSEVQYDSASRLWGGYPWGENDDSLVTNHSITLTGLNASTTYYFRVGSIDGSGNGPTTSIEMTFTTEAAYTPIPPSAPTRLRIINR